MLKVILLLEPVGNLLIGRGLGSDLDLREDVIVILLLVLISLLLLYGNLDG